MILLTVPSRAAAAFLKSNMVDKPGGAEMAEAIRKPESVEEWGATTRLMVRANPEAWEALLDFCTSTGRTYAGESIEHRRFAARQFRLAARLRTNLERLANHPAYKGLAVVGVDTTELPARRMPTDERWWPSTRMALEAVPGDPAQVEVAVLYPELTKARGRVFTAWTARP